MTPLDTAATRYKEYMTNLQGKQYMIVQGRVKWFRDEHPSGCIDTDFKQVGDYTIATCKVLIESQIIASGSATVRAWAKGKDPRDIEKAETAAIGRALANAGYGTQFSGDELDDTDYLADSPIEKPSSTTSTTSTPKSTSSTQPASDNKSKINEERKRLANTGKPKAIYTIEYDGKNSTVRNPRYIAWWKPDSSISQPYKIVLFNEHCAKIAEALHLDWEPGKNGRYPTQRFKTPIDMYTTWIDKGNYAKFDKVESTFKSSAVRARFFEMFDQYSPDELKQALGVENSADYQGGLSTAIEAVTDYADGQAQIEVQDAPDVDEPPANITPLKQTAMAGMPRIINE